MQEKKNLSSLQKGNTLLLLGTGLVGLARFRRKLRKLLLTQEPGFSPP